MPHKPQRIFDHDQPPDILNKFWTRQEGTLRYVTKAKGMKVCGWIDPWNRPLKEGVNGLIPARISNTAKTLEVTLEII